MNSKGKRLMPRYLLKFLDEIYTGDKIIYFGRRMVTRSFIGYVKNLYLLSGRKAPDDLGRRMVPEYLIKWIEDADFIEFVDDEIAYTKEVPPKALNFALLYKLGGMSYKYNQLVHFDTTAYTSGKTYRNDELGFTLTADTSDTNYALPRINFIENHSSPKEQQNPDAKNS